MIPIALATLVLDAGFSGHPFNQMETDFIFSLLSEVWAVTFGAIWVFVACRHRGKPGRRDCFLMGIIGALTLPSILMQVLWALDGTSELAVWGLVLVSLLATPFGLLGGWFFWRLSIIPATPSEAEIDIAHS